MARVVHRSTDPHSSVLPSLVGSNVESADTTTHNKNHSTTDSQTEQQHAQRDFDQQMAAAKRLPSGRRQAATEVLGEMVRGVASSNSRRVILASTVHNNKMMNNRPNNNNRLTSDTRSNSNNSSNNSTQPNGVSSKLHHQYNRNTIL
eukprot:Lankesteria_metandrocarpae@DN6362_c0_g1_i1.p1